MNIMGETKYFPFMPGDKCYFIDPGKRMEAIIDNIFINKDGVSYEWYQLDHNPEDLDEVWDDGEFQEEDIGVTVFPTFEEADKASRKQYPGYYKALEEYIQTNIVDNE